jgi:hypothetical protein
MIFLEKKKITHLYSSILSTGVFPINFLIKNCFLIIHPVYFTNNSSLFNEFVCKLGFFGMSGPV